MQTIKDKLIVALDVDNLDRARKFVDILYPAVKIFKVGSQLFTASGPEAVKMVGEKGAQVFLDLKFHDIPNTVFQSVSVGTGLSYTIITTDIRDTVHSAVFMMTVHTRGGIEMLRAAVKGATDKAKELKITRPFIVGVTRLTSERSEENTQGAVLEAARLAKEAGLDGVVCSALEAPMIRKEFGNNFLIVTPGIRPKGYPSDDQSRVVTAKEAIEAGASYIVVGRPIIEAKNPREAAEAILEDIK
jgi:orotidine-5'-phosphate decarboxylase